MPTARVTWVNGRQFVGETGSGHATVLDTSLDEPTGQVVEGPGQAS